MSNDSLKDLTEIKNGAMHHTDVAEIITEDHSKNSRLKKGAKYLLEAEQRYSNAADLLIKTNDRLIVETDALSKKSKQACAAVKSTVNEIKDQLLKVDNILGDNVEHKIKQLERVALALTTISELASDKQTMAVVAAMINKG